MTGTPIDREGTARATVDRWLASLAAPLHRGWAVGLTLALIVLGGGLLRYHGLNWDQPDDAEAPLHLHPDERFLSIVADNIDWPDSVGEYFDTGRSKLNPYNAPETPSFVYGTFPLFAVKGVASLAGADVPVLSPAARRLCERDSYDTTLVCGRKITAAIDTSTILLVFLLALALFGRGVALASAALYALAVLPTQLAHFWAVDPFVVFFSVLTILLSVYTVRARSGAALVALGLGAGAAGGLAVACKVSAVPVFLAPTLAMATRIGVRDLTILGLRWRGGDLPSPRVPGQWMSDLAVLCMAGVVAMIVFRLAQPYAFAGPHFWDTAINQYWWDDIFDREWDYQRGASDYPPFVQFAGRAAYLEPLANIVLWGLGPMLGLAALAGAVAAGAQVFRRRELTPVIPLVFALVTFAIFGGRFVAFMRYFASIYPVLCIFGAWGLMALWRVGAHPPIPSLARGIGTPGGRGLVLAARGVVVLVFGATAFWAIAFQNVYADANPRIRASEWIYANVPRGAALSAEYWDDSLPFPLPGRDFFAYSSVNFDLYATDSIKKWEAVVFGVPEGQQKHAGGLAGTDYVVVSSARVRESVKRLEREYPATIRFYELLDSGALGFERVATFRTRPSFLGITIDDSHADESFTVYDHPEVRIYRKTERFNPEHALALILEAAPERAINLLPGQGGTNGLQLTAAGAATQQGGGTWSAIFDEDGWASGMPWLWWLLWLELSAFAALPWVTWLCRALPERGYGLSKPLGLVSVALPAWALVAWGGPHLSGALAWEAWGAALLVGLGVGMLRRRTLFNDLKTHWRTWLTAELVFLALFFAFLALRAANPDLWHHPRGGEKPMELAYLAAVAKSSTLPPYDPWFAGGTMNYYYMGWFLLAVPMRALQIVPEVAFNLGVATYAALAGVAAFSVAANLVGLTQRRQAGADIPGSGAGGDRRGPGRVIAGGLLGAGLLGVAGNLDGGHQLIERLQAVNTWDPTDGLPVVGGALGIVGGLWQVVAHGAGLPPYDWWRSSRVHLGTYDITEFPYWSFLFADLHPHVMDIPVFVSLTGLGIAYVAAAHSGLRSQIWVLGAVLGLFVGLVRTVHTWDFPAAVILAVGAIILGQVLTTGRWQERFWRVAAHLAIAGAVAAGFFAPYTAHFETFETGLQRAPERTEAQQHFAHFGLFLSVTVVFVALGCRDLVQAGKRSPLLYFVRGQADLAGFAVAIAGLVVLTWRFNLTMLALSVVLELFLLQLLWFELRARDNAGRTAILALLVLAVAISAGVDVVTVKNDIVRMNTVFKFSLQAWHLFALGSAAAVVAVAEGLWRMEGWRPRVQPGRGLEGWGAAAAGSVLAVGALAFLPQGTPARQSERFADTGWTLNGLAYIEHGTYTEDQGTPNPQDDRPFALAEDEPLIRWLRANVEGSPVIVEATAGLYHWAGRMTMHTGLPSVIGWDWHQTQQRWAYAGLVQERRADTQRFYREGPEQAATYLRKYNVRYVIVGTEERALGTPAGLAKFGTMPGLREVFRSGENVIYEVDQRALVVPRDAGAIRAP